MKSTIRATWGDNAANQRLLDHYAPLSAASEVSRRSRRLILKQWAWRLTVSSAQVIKRTLDIVVAACALLLLSPLLLATWLAIRIEDPGPAIFPQVRVGYRGRHFVMYKFRSMIADADKLKAALAAQNESADGILFKMRRDPRITKVGRIIRKLSIDELPQLFNVLRGDMSLVGPRPALPAEVARYSQPARVRLDAKPGITCIWQVSGRSNIDFAGQVRLDLQYIRSQSVFNDLMLLIKTVPAVITGKGAY